MTPSVEPRPGSAPTPPPGRRDGFALGRIAGVPVRAHWSVLVIMGLIAAELAGQTLPDAYPTGATWSYWALGLAAAVVFLLALLAHEAAHAVVARRNGVGVESITLWMFGGVTRLTGEARTPGAEVRIAGAGPLMSLLLGGGFFGLAVLLSAVGADGLLEGTLRWLGVINVLLALFNALPGAPLDGGRLLRAGFWKWRGDRVWASIAAARVGTLLGLGLIVLGAVEFVRSNGDFSALWLALVGWFLMDAARSEERATRLGRSLETVSVGDVMDPHPVIAPPVMSLAGLLHAQVLTDRQPALALVDEGRPVGLLTLEQVRAVAEADRTSTSLGAVATPMPEVPVASPDQRVTELIPQLGPATGGRALVVEDGRLVGMVGPDELTRAVEQARSRPVRAGGRRG